MCQAEYLHSRQLSPIDHLCPVTSCWALGDVNSGFQTMPWTSALRYRCETRRTCRRLISTDECYRLHLGERRQLDLQMMQPLGP